MICAYHNVSRRGILALIFLGPDEFVFLNAEELRTLALEQFKIQGGFNCFGAMDVTQITVKFGGQNDLDKYKCYNVRDDF